MLLQGAHIVFIEHHALASHPTASLALALNRLYQGANAAFRTAEAVCYIVES